MMVRETGSTATATSLATNSLVTRTISQSLRVIKYSHASKFLPVKSKEFPDADKAAVKRGRTRNVHDINGDAKT
jgi:hypothetical protein